jgi:hypothetical protein
MADKGWISRVATAAGAAAGTGAAQLGLGYGLGVIVWPLAATTDDSDWLGSLSWATWITASATVFGAVLASRLGGGPARRWSGAWRLTLAASAAVGALVAVALIALPARSAVRDDAFSPQVTAGGYALLGVLFGLIVAYFAVASKPIAANLMATGVLLWGLAITAIVVELAWHRDSATYLTSWQFAQATDGERFGTIFWPSALLTLAAAFLIAAIAVIPAIRRGNRGLGAAVSGVVGPLLVAVAFLALAPRLTGSLGPLESAYLIAPYAVLAGLAGSALAVTTGRAAADRRSRQAAAQAAPVLAAVTGGPHSATTSPYDISDLSDHSGRSLTDDTTASLRPSPSGPSETLAAKNPAAPTAGPHSVATSQKAPASRDVAAAHQQPNSRDVVSGHQAEPDGGDQPETKAPRQRGRLARLIGRAKVPAQPSGSPLSLADTQSAGNASVSAAEPPADAASPAPRTNAAAAVAAPVPTPAGTGRSPVRPTSFADGTASPSDPATKAAGASATPGNAVSDVALPDKADKSGKPGRTARRGRLAAGEAPQGHAAAEAAVGGGDPEIAAAARPNRERARKATTSAPAPPKSTVTPPPSVPTIAQINPKPPADK